MSLKIKNHHRRKTMTNDFNLDLKALKSCEPAMSDEETRYYLCGVHIFERDDSVIYEATNGHIAVRVESELQNEEFDYHGIDFILPAFIVKHLCKAAFVKGFGLEGDFIPCHVDAPRINLEMLDGLINFKLVDGVFPEIDAVIPKTSTIAFNKINVNGKYMDALSKSISVLSGSRLLALQFTGERYGSPILIENENFPNWTGILMPATLFDAEEGVVDEKQVDPEKDEAQLLPDECVDVDDELYEKAVEVVRREDKASTSFVQRNLQIGYNRAARIIEQMENNGVISASNESGKREVLGFDQPEEDYDPDTGLVYGGMNDDAAEIERAM